MKTSVKRYTCLRHLSLLICVVWPLFGSAQSDAPQPQRKVGTILKDIKSTESDVNKLFNALNSSDAFDLVCYAYQQTGSKTRQRICEPQFMKKARNSEAQRFITGTREGTDRSVPNSDVALQELMQEEIMALRAELLTAAQQSPEFNTLVLRLQALVSEYAAHEKARDNDPALGFLSRFLQRSSVN